MPRSVKDACFQASRMPAAYAKITEVYLKRCAGAVEDVAVLSKATSALRDAPHPHSPLAMWRDVTAYWRALPLPRARKTRRTPLSRRSARRRDKKQTYQKELETLRDRLRTHSTAGSGVIQAWDVDPSDAWPDGRI